MWQCSFYNKRWGNNAYNQALDDCLKICEKFRDYDQDRDCKGIIDGIEGLRKL